MERKREKTTRAKKMARVKTTTRAKRPGRMSLSGVSAKESHMSSEAFSSISTAIDHASCNTFEKGVWLSKYLIVNHSRANCDHNHYHLVIIKKVKKYVLLSRLRMKNHGSILTSRFRVLLHSVIRATPKCFTTVAPRPHSLRPQRFNLRNTQFTKSEPSSSAQHLR